jgi:L-lysine 6-transaminase
MKKLEPKKVFDVLQKSILVDGFDMVLDPVKSRGARLYDSKHNRTMIDLFSFFASNPIGMNHPRLSEKAFEEKLLRFAKTKVSNSDIYTTAYAEFVSSFHKIAAPMFDRFFFIDGGALGVENAIKTAQDWKVRKNLEAGKGERGTQVLHFKEAFHGRTGYTLSLTNTAPEKILYFPKFDWPRVTNPKVQFPLTKENSRKTELLEKQSIAEIEQAFRDRPDEICCIIIETIQGEGGDNFFRAEFFQKLREICDQNEALLIFDEVQTGLGLTGKFWAFEHFKVLPDMIAFGKKTQVCGCAVRLNRLKEVDHVFKVSSRINSTFGGNLVDMVRTTQYLEIIVEENLLKHVTKLGNEMKIELDSMSEKFEEITAVRGLGLWMAFDLPSLELRNDLLDRCWKNGLIVLGCGTKSVRIRPILDLKSEEAEQALDLLQKSAEEAFKVTRRKTSGAKKS